MGIYDGQASTPTVPDIELGMYDATLVGVEATYLEGGQYGEGFTTTDENGNKVNRFRWAFGLKGEDGEALYELDEEGEPTTGDPIEVDCVTGLQFFAKAKNPSKQTRIMKALLTKDEFEAWAEGESAPGLKTLIGRPCQVQVDENSKGYPTAANVLPPRARRARRAGGARPVEAETEGDAE